MDRFASVDQLKGVGEKSKKMLEKLELFTIDDLLTYYPRTYRKFEECTSTEKLREGETVAVCAQTVRPLTVQYVKRMQITTAHLSDGKGEVLARWFRMPYLKNTIVPGKCYVFYGKISRKGTSLILDQPAVYQPDQYEEMRKVLQPVYMLTKGVTNHMLTKLIRQAMEEIDLSRDFLPEGIRKSYHLAEYDYSMEEIHFPRDEHHRKLARDRLVFDEFFLFILALKIWKERTEENESVFQMKRDTLADVTEKLGYELTGAQKQVWKEILDDMSGGRVMNRLIQGDVGSGKTIIAFLAMILAARNEMQSVLMVPTEVLARQHYEAFQKLTETQNLPVCAVLLTGSMTAKEKRIAYEKISAHEADVVIGTHAVIQEKVIFDRLGLVITDEQHRFGVRQREALGEKSEKMPHTMVMSATPIPRTLAVILYGDLEISTIDELPSNRIPIKNCVVNTSYRKKAYDFISREVKDGHQAYVICPMVEESEMIDAEDVISYTEKLKQELPSSVCVEYLHGKMKPKEKNEIMERFLKNQIQVLVSTTVVEVGVNVPNATVMMIENAERFGLAQLHQLRGRVGRGGKQSYCIMINGSENGSNQKRLDILNRSNDGFYIASEDLKLRGPGELLGVRQSGAMEFKIGDIYSDSEILKEAGKAVSRIKREDPELEQPCHRELKKRLNSYMKNELKNLSL